MSETDALADLGIFVAAFLGVGAALIAPAWLAIPVVLGSLGVLAACVAGSHR